MEEGSCKRPAQAGPGARGIICRAMRNIVILISGGGSNMEAIVRASRAQHWAARCGARVAAVISNRAAAGGLDLARRLGVPVEVVEHRDFPDREAFEARLLERIAHHEEPGAPVLVALAGFMRVLTRGFVRHFDGRMVNIHPSLLPAFAGLHTHRRALQAGCRFSGATVHLVTPDLDSGPILAQAVVPVLHGDTEETLAARVLTQEHLIYPQAIAELLGRGGPWDNRADASKGPS